MIPKPYPREWPRMLDLLPPLGLQVTLDKDLELYWCQAAVSMQRGKIPSKPIKTDLGLIRIDTTSSDRVLWESGSPKPSNQITPTQEEIIKEIIGNLSIELPEITIKVRGVVEKIPKSLEDLEPFQGAEDVFYQQTGQGNFTHMLRRRVGLPFDDTYRLMKGELLSRKIVTSWHAPVFKRMRSTLKTDYMRTDASGYLALGRENIFRLSKAVCEKKWWQDIGLVHPIEARINSALFSGNIYRLWKRKALVAV